MTKTLDPCTILEYIFNLFKIRLGKVHKLIILWVLEQTHVRKGQAGHQDPYQQADILHMLRVLREKKGPDEDQARLPYPFYDHQLYNML